MCRDLPEVLDEVDAGEPDEYGLKDLKGCRFLGIPAEQWKVGKRKTQEPGATWMVRRCGKRRGFQSEEPKESLLSRRFM